MGEAKDASIRRSVCPRNTVDADPTSRNPAYRHHAFKSACLGSNGTMLKVPQIRQAKKYRPAAVMAKPTKAPAARLQNDPVSKSIAITMELLANWPIVCINAVTPAR